MNGALTLFGLLLAIYSVQPMTIGKRQADGQMTLCGQHTPCGWGVYVSSTRQMDYFVRNMCQCDRPRERCLRSGEDVSISAYVYRCVRSRSSPSGGNQIVGGGGTSSLMNPSSSDVLLNELQN